jgi:hypothetical protein
MIHGISKGRALPLAWRVRQAPKGHFPAELHIALVDLISGCIPVGTQVGLLGDGEVDGTRLQRTRQDAGWAYACRMATRTVASWEGETCRRDALGAWLKPGRLIACKEVHGTREAYGPILVLCCWATGYPEPWYLVSHMATAEEACRWYEKRFRLETFCSDQKRRGCHIHKSHIDEVQRLSRLLIAACLA